MLDIDLGETEHPDHETHQDLRRCDEVHRQRNAQMKTPYVSRQWHDLETLKEVAQSFKDSTNYRSKFTSVDRISELQEIVHLTTGALESYSIENEDTCNSLRNELSILRGYLVGLVGEFEDSIYELERLTTSLHVSRKEPVVDAEVSATEPEPEQSDIEVIADLYQSNEHSDSDDSFGSTFRRSQTKPAVSAQAIAETGETRERFVDMLIKWERLGYEIKWKAEGHWQTSIYSYPSEEAMKLLNNLVDYGVKVSGGKRFLMFSRLHGQKRVIPESGSIHTAESEQDFLPKLGEKTSLEAVHASQDYMDLLDNLRRRGYRVEKQVSGKWLTSLSDYPDEETKAILLKLLDLGLEIWPGRGFMW